MVLKRLKEYIDSKGISVSAFEKSIGMSNASFGKSLKQGGAIGSDKLEKILIIYSDISPEWLLTGKGEMIQVDTNLKDDNPPYCTLESESLVAEGKISYQNYRQLAKAEIDRLKEEIKAKDKQVSDLIKMNLYLLEREKGGGHSMPESAKEDRSVG